MTINRNLQLGISIDYLTNTTFNWLLVEGFPVPQDGTQTTRLTLLHHNGFKAMN